MIYAPASINDIVYHSVTERALINDIAAGKMQFPACGKNGILLYGIYGTGKTTLAKLLPDAIENGKGGGNAIYDFFACEQGQNGASLFLKIRNRAQFMSFNYSGYHYFVLDEVDNLTAAAMASLKTAMGIAKTIFIMTTNNISAVDMGVSAGYCRLHGAGCQLSKKQGRRALTSFLRNCRFYTTAQCSPYKRAFLLFSLRFLVL